MDFYGVFKEFLIQFVGFFTVAINVSDLCLLQSSGNIVGRGFGDGLIGGAFDLAVTDYVP